MSMSQRLQQAVREATAGHGFSLTHRLRVQSTVKHACDRPEHVRHGWGWVSAMAGRRRCQIDEVGNVVEAARPLPRPRNMTTRVVRRRRRRSLRRATAALGRSCHLRNRGNTLPHLDFLYSTLLRPHLIASIDSFARSSCLIHRHGTLAHAGSHQPRATKPFGGMLARTELRFVPPQFSRLRVVCASTSRTIACESLSLLFHLRAVQPWCASEALLIVLPLTSTATSSYHR
jgi:hypothetical protein